MLFMNDYDLYRAGQVCERIPALAKAVKIVQILADEANAHSDGWAHWPKPARAAKKLMELIQKRDPNTTEAQVKAACAPIKAFYTKIGDQAGMKRPEMP